MYLVSRISYLVSAIVFTCVRAVSVLYSPVSVPRLRCARARVYAVPGRAIVSVPCPCVRVRVGVGVFSAHQMGSNRMGVDPSASVVDEDGEMWECDGVYLCDVSLTPQCQDVCAACTCPCPCPCAICLCLWM